MSFVLHIDTAGQTASIAISANDTLLVEKLNANQFDHASWIHTALQEAMREANLLLEKINVKNNLSDQTTVHWHGFHIPAVMDGGPHQIIDAGATWSPNFKIKNNAGTYWYHPHLHMKTYEQLAKGAGGFIIVKDPAESALALPRTYGTDDIPIVFSSRRFKIANDPFGTGTLIAFEVNFPSKEGNAFETALPAPVSVITMFNAAALPLLYFLCMLSTKFWSFVYACIVSK